jgi:hypothetical protein
MFLLLLIIVSSFAERQIWSHRCRQSKYPENDIDACRLASEIFDGIEVDVHWHDSHFWLHHDHWYLATSTLLDLIKLDLPGGLWVDMKTSELDSLPTLIDLVQNHSNVLVEVYDKKMMEPLQNANITITSTHFDTPIRSIWMPRYIFFGVDKQRFMSWHMDYLCMMDTFFDSGGELALTDLYYRPQKCSHWMSITTARIVAWIVLLCVLTLLLLCFVCFICCCCSGNGYKKIPTN